MGYIYKITNKVNGKVYIGKTESSVEKRWKEHCSDYRKNRCKDRPLYRAMLRHGLENFSVSEIEYTENSNIREVYWIDFYDSYSKGYNATKGGDGKTYVNTTKIIELNKLGYNSKQIQQITKHDCSTIRKVLYKNNLTPNILKPENSKEVFCEELNLKFDSQYSAARYLLDKNYTKSSSISSIANKISLCCRKIKNKAYKFSWKYVEKLNSQVV